MTFTRKPGEKARFVRAIVLGGSALLATGCDRTSSVLAPAGVAATRAIAASVGGASFRKVLPCRDGGSIELHATAPNTSNSKGTGQFKVNATVKPERCRWTAPEGPIQLSGAPHLVLHASREVTRGVPAREITGKLKGNAAWTLRGQTVTCRVDAAFTIDLARPFQPAISGTECEKFLIKRFLLLD